MQSTEITVIIIFDKVVPEMDFELKLNKFKRFVQVMVFQSPGMR